MHGFAPENLRNIEGVGSVVHQREMTSTSDIARKLLDGESGQTLPMLVICDQQTAGRGQQDKSWQSDGNSLTFTWCVSANSIPQHHHALLPIIAGVSVCEAIDTLGIDGAKLKWPNDVLLNGNKVCGILAESVRSHGASVLLFGIGINVNQSQSELSALKTESNHFPAGSLFTASGSVCDKQEVLSTALKKLQSNLADETDLLARCKRRFAFVDQQIEFAVPNGKVVSGQMIGISNSGQIQIRTESETLSFPSGQILKSV